MHKMIDLTRQPSRERKPHLQVVYLPGCSFMSGYGAAAKMLQKRRFLKFGTASHERTKHWDPWDHTNRGTSSKAPNGKASCYTLLRRITRLKCVTSEFRSVIIDPKQGCLKWPYGTMSESP